jgi:hypothetical protein
MSVDQAKLVQLLKDHGIATHKDLRGDQYVICSLDKIRRLFNAVERGETRQKENHEPISHP